MKAVNLASKPFVNRRPVIRIAFLVWVAAIALAVVNIWSYSDFFRVASNHRARLADLEQEIRIEEEQVASLEKRVNALRLDDGNNKARYLNGLIHQRIFPWSRLFDEIQDVLPKDVYLVGLAPQIEKVEKSKRPRKTPASSSSRSQTSRSQSTRPTTPAPKIPEQTLDRVLLKLEGVARSDEAMLELVDRLYASANFLDPTLSSEKRESRSGLVVFQIEVTYLTRTLPVTLAGGDVVADAAAEGEPDAGEASAASDRLAGEPAGSGGLYGQPGFTPPAGSAPAGSAPAAGGAARDRRAQSRPGFEPETRDTPAGFGSGGAAPGVAAAPGGPATGGRTSSSTRSQQPVQPGFVVQPGFAPAAGNAPSARPQQDGGTVVIPRRSPTSLGASPSSSPRLGAGGG